MCASRSGPLKPPFLLLLLLAPRCTAQYVRQVLIAPTVDPSKVRAGVSTLSGPTEHDRVRRRGYSDGEPDKARFGAPMGVAAGSNGDTFVADMSNHVIRRCSTGGWTSTLAGKVGESGLVDGRGGDARFYNPVALAVGSDDAIYVADASNHAIRRITNGQDVVTLFAGRSYVTAEKRAPGGSLQPQGLWNPHGVLVWPGAEGVPDRLIVADTDNHRLLWLAPGASAGAPWELSLFAGGGGAQGFSDGAAATVASFSYPRGVALCIGALPEPTRRSLGALVQKAGSSLGATAAEVDVSVSRTDAIPTIAAATSVSAAAAASGAQSASAVTAAALAAMSDAEADAAARILSDAAAAAESAQYYVLVADSGNNAIRRISHSLQQPGDGARVHTLAGDGAPGDDDSRTRLEKPKASVLLTSILEARFSLPMGVACGEGGGAVVADTLNHRVRQVRGDGVTVTVAGANSRGMRNGNGDGARFDAPAGIAYDARNRRMVVADRDNAAIRLVRLNSEALLESAASSLRGSQGHVATSTLVALAAACLLITQRLPVVWPAYRQRLG